MIDSISNNLRLFESKIKAKVVLLIFSFFYTKGLNIFWILFKIQFFERIAFLPNFSFIKCITARYGCLKSILGPEKRITFLTFSLISGL